MAFVFLKVSIKQHFIRVKGFFSREWFRVQISHNQATTVKPKKQQCSLAQSNQYHKKIV